VRNLQKNNAKKLKTKLKMAIIELFIIFIKIIFYSTIYSSLILLALFIFSKVKKWSILEAIMKRKMKFWLIIHFIISLSFFIFSFSYWQDLGLGDNHIIPIGYDQTIQNEEFSWTYFYPDLTKTEQNKDEIIITNFKIENEILCAEVSHQNADSPKYDFIVYNLKTKIYKTFENKKEFEIYAKENNLPEKEKFYNFDRHYDEYLNSKPKWQNYLLPR
jgi:heme/copper-type cytochrome/quinol oxidase subunit 2